MLFETVSTFAPQSIDEHLLPGARIALYAGPEPFPFGGIIRIPSPSLPPEPTVSRTLELISGEGDDDNSVFELIWNELRLNYPPSIGGRRRFSPIDFEVQDSFSIRLRTALVNSEAVEISSSEEVLTFSVNDLADPFSDQSNGRLLWYNVASNEMVGWEIRENQIFGTQAVFTFPSFVPLPFPPVPTVSVPYVNGSRWGIFGGNGSNWEVVGSGDFSGDGNLALLQRDRRTLNLRVMMLEDGQLDGFVDLETSALPDQSWNVIATDDFNTDGKADIVWQNQTTGATTIWYLEEQPQQIYIDFGPKQLAGRNSGNQLDLSLAGFADGVITNSNLSIEATGDFNNDNKVDFVVRDQSSGNIKIWLMDQAQLTGQYELEGIADPNWTVMSSSDFNGDGKADLAWHNRLTGEVQLWNLDGQTILSKISLDAPVDPALAPVSDYSPSEFDILLRDQVTGGVSLAGLSDRLSTVESNLQRNLTDPNWRFVSLGDLDDDGQDDAVLRHSSGQVLAWYLDRDRPKIAAERLIGRLLPQDWNIAGIDDFNGDNQADLLLHNAAADQTLAWFMDNQGNILSETLVGRRFEDNRWSIVATADFTGDGQADWLLRHYRSGQNLLMEMDGTEIVSERLIGRIVEDLNWHIVGAKDLNRDGEVDIILQNNLASQTLLWEMKDGHIAQERLIKGVADSNTQLVF